MRIFQRLALAVQAAVEQEVFLQFKTKGTVTSLKQMRDLQVQVCLAEAMAVQVETGQPTLDLVMQTLEAQETLQIKEALAAVAVEWVDTETQWILILNMDHIQFTLPEAAAVAAAEQARL
jgi:hypothetical protein